MKLRRPTLDVIGDPAQLLEVLSAFYDGLRELAGLVPTYKTARATVTLPTFAAARAVPGDPTGANGPMACLVCGQLSPKDGLQGPFVWDPFSTAADDNTNTLQAAGVATGRWRRM
jgi:hypothetical protein